jgi:hypothetical protein
VAAWAGVVGLFAAGDYYLSQWVAPEIFIGRMHADHDATDISSRTSTHRRSRFGALMVLGEPLCLRMDRHGLALLLRLQLSFDNLISRVSWQQSYDSG